MNEPIITVVGNLVADPELRTSQSGNPWVTFRIASTPQTRDRNTGKWVDGEALWLGCRAFGTLAENIASTLTKGTRVIVQGQLSQRSYTDNQGQQRTSLDLNVDAIGPELRFATAQVTRSAARGQGGFGSSQGGFNGQQAQSAWGSAAGGDTAQQTPWGNAGGAQQDPWADAGNSAAGGDTAAGGANQDPWGAAGTF
ncbi:single-stranded DNA-binding protein [Canibacter zhoujuaniae]|uniref:single-stranded DNA-binding protein n=1 Tax=Canibacter zhoujuaniae TaxID=2708343 RepID=UPI00141FB1C0|nr:single-stranded DNA-binding protein [Canibacter zhoujuaniae]